ncbi:DNA helicase [Tanacetum coccineum]
MGINIVSETMMHGPCGAANIKASCMKGDKCGKSFPKKFNSKTFFDDNGHVHYQRRDTSITTTRNQFKLDNSYVVPYNRDLLLAFRAHINIKYCGWSMLIKYLFKYISKGTDKDNVEGRFICAHEAYWIIFKFDIHHREPVVQILAGHVEDMQRITFRDRDRLRSVVDLPGKKNTTLSEWFAYNASNETGRHLSYLEFPSKFVWNSDSKSWSPRRNSKSSIGRLAYVHPTSGELFFLRMLLCHQKVCRDFFEVQTINDVFYLTYRAACEALGLLDDDREWETTLEEACASATSEQLRFMSQDIPKKVSEKVQIPNYHFNADSLQGYTLSELEIILNNCGKSLQSFVLLSPHADLLEQLANRLLMEERNYNQEELTQLKNDYVPRLNVDQKAIYDLIMDADENSRQELIFVYGHGGTGKTFLWKTIISSLHSQGKIVLAVTSSGIASLLLPSGRTAHSIFKLPLKLTKESLCRITKNTQLGKLLADTDLLIWDEAPMNDCRCFEALDRSLRDIVNKSFSLFGGKSVLLGGDFGFHIKTKHLGLARLDTTLEERSLVNSFASWPLDIYDRKTGRPAEQRGSLKIQRDTSWHRHSFPAGYCLSPTETMDGTLKRRQWQLMTKLIEVQQGSPALQAGEEDHPAGHSRHGRAQAAGRSQCGRAGQAAVPGRRTAARVSKPAQPRGQAAQREPPARSADGAPIHPATVSQQQPPDHNQHSGGSRKTALYARQSKIHLGSTFLLATASLLMNKVFQS